MISRSRAFISALCLLGCVYPAGSHAQAAGEHSNVFFDVSPDGEQIAFSSADGDLYLFDLNARTVRQLTKTEAVETGPAYSPDGASLAYVSSANEEKGQCIFRMVIDGTGATQLTSDAAVSDAAPTFSPDGSQIAFARAHLHRPFSLGGWTWDDSDVYVMDADGGNVKRLTQNKYRGIGRVKLSPDGKKVLFVADNDRAASDLDSNVFEVAVDGSAPPKTAIPQPMSAGDYAAWGSDPAFSPDGQQLVVLSDRDAEYHYDLVLIDLGSGKAQSLKATAVSEYNQWPVFASDGEHIFFMAGTEETWGGRFIFSLWSIGVDGKNLHEVAGSGLFTKPSEWRDAE